MSDLELQIAIDAIAAKLKECGMSAEQIRETLTDEAERVALEIADGTF